MRTLDLETLHLERGDHKSLEEGVCLLEAIAYIAGEPWSDAPQCVSPVIAAFLRNYNDSVSDEKRQELKQYIPRLIGTRGSNALEERRAIMAGDWLVRTHTPAWLRLIGLTADALALASFPEITSMAQLLSIKFLLETARKNAAAARAAAEPPTGTAGWDAVWAVTWSAAAASARNATSAAAGNAASAATEVVAEVVAGSLATWNDSWDVSWDVSWDTSWDASWTAAWSGVRDAARASTKDAAMAAAGAALQPTVDALQASVPDLIERMISADRLQ